MSAKSKRKGSAGEREVASLLAPLFGEGVKRGLAQCRDASESADVEGTPYWIESKRYKGIAACRFLDQATKAALGDGRPPIVFMREDRGAWCCLCSAELMLEMMRLCQPTTPFSKN